MHWQSDALTYVFMYCSLSLFFFFSPPVPACEKTAIHHEQFIENPTQISNSGEKTGITIVFILLLYFALINHLHIV